MASSVRKDTEVEEAKKEAVKLLKEMADDLPLRSDTKRRKAEIEHIEEVFSGDEDADNQDRE